MRAQTIKIFVLIVFSLSFFPSCKSYYIKRSTNDLQLINTYDNSKKAEKKYLQSLESSPENQMKIQKTEEEAETANKIICKIYANIFKKPCHKTCGGAGCPQERFLLKGIVTNGGKCPTNSGGNCAILSKTKISYYLDLGNYIQNLKFTNSDGETLKIKRKFSIDNPNATFYKIKGLKKGRTYTVEFSTLTDNSLKSLLLRI